MKKLKLTKNGNQRKTPPLVGSGRMTLTKLYEKYEIIRHSVFYCSIVLLFYCLLPTAYYLLPTDVFAQQNWLTYDTSNSPIISNFIETIKVDNNGFIWLGTFNGVSKYLNDSTWLYYSTNGGTDSGLIHNDVKAIAIDNHNNLWFGTYGGITKLEPDNNWTNFTAADGLIHHDVHTIAIDEYENLWIGTADGVSLFDGDTWTNFTKPLPDTIPIPDTLSISDTIFFADTFIVADSSIITDSIYIYQPPGLIHNSINAITIDPTNGSVWFATDAGISEFTTDSNWFNYTICDSTNLFYNKVNSIAIDSNGNLWFGSHYLGLFKFDGTNWTNYFAPDSADSIATLSDNTIYALFIDNSNNLWLGTASGGVCKFDIATETWTNYTTNDGLAYHWVTTIAQDNNGNMWFGTWSGGVSVLTATANINEITQTENFVTIYPNPNNGVFTIQLKTNPTVDGKKVKTNIKIYNIYGQIIYTSFLSSPIIQKGEGQKFDLSSYPKGIYLVQIISDSGVITKKIIIE